MSEGFILKNGFIVNEGAIFKGHIVVLEGKIHRIIKAEKNVKIDEFAKKLKTIDITGKYVIPGVIDDQVHFREPGLTQKGDIRTESRAAVAGGVTSYMEMPNTIPNVLTREILNEKYNLAAEKSLANYSFYMGASNDNIDEVLKANRKDVCGLKIFMGSSTGNMLVDNLITLETLFSKSKLPVAVHCEDESVIRRNTNDFKLKLGENIPVEYHPLIRSEKACFRSSSLAIALARRYKTRLHVLHLSTAKELELFKNSKPLAEKNITSEVCIHHLWFNESDYKDYGMRIKWNPAIKSENDREALFNAMLDGTIDVIATDHAPHLLEEKNKSYFEAPSGGPMVQHSLPAMISFVERGKISLEKVIEKMCHNPAICFNIDKRGFIREGYWADLAVLDLEAITTVTKENILYKCGWSPFEGHVFPCRVVYTFINGHLAWDNRVFDDSSKGMRLEFNR